MDKVLGWWQQRRQAAKLARGRCRNCERILRDDNLDRYCSHECFLDEQSRLAW